MEPSGENGDKDNDNNGAWEKIAATFHAHRLTQQQLQQQPQNEDPGVSSSSWASTSTGGGGRKVNNVWADVAQAEQIQNAADQFDIISIVDKFKIIRGPETYVVGEKRKRPANVTAAIQSQGQGGQNYGQKRAKWDKQVDIEVDYCADYETDSSISSGGISDDANVDLRRRSDAKKAAFQQGVKARPRKLVKRRKRKEKLSMFDTDSSEEEVEEDEPAKEELVDQKIVKIEPVKKKRTSRQIMEEQMAELEDWKVAHFIANRLKEKKKKLILKTMKILEKEATLNLFWKTLKIERLGGLMIKNGSRRRTPGGVFLYLLRNDQRFNQEKVREIFKEERDARKADQKVTRLEKDKKYFSHIARLIQRRNQSKRPKVSNGGKVQNTKEEMNTDSEEEEMEDSYVLPPAVPMFTFTAPTSAQQQPLQSSNSQTNTQPSGNGNGNSNNSRQKLVSYADDFLDIHCDADDDLF